MRTEPAGGCAESKERAHARDADRGRVVGAFRVAAVLALWLLFAPAGTGFVRHLPIVDLFDVACPAGDVPGELSAPGGDRMG